MFPELPLLARMDEEVAVVLFVVAGVVGAIAIMAGVWLSAQRSAYDARLKQLMIERGMSPQEIEQVLQARSSNDCGHKATDAMREAMAGRRVTKL